MSVQLALLGFLQERDYHGYDLKKTIERLMGMWTDIKFGSIYHALGSLERFGFVRKVATLQSGGKPARSVFSITPNGRAEFARLLRDNILTPQRVLLKDDIGVFFGGRIAPAEFEAILRIRLALVEELTALLTRHRGSMVNYAPRRLPVAHQLITRHIMHLETEREWFSTLLREVAEGRLYAGGEIAEDD